MGFNNCLICTKTCASCTEKCANQIWFSSYTNTWLRSETRSNSMV